MNYKRLTAIAIVISLSGCAAKTIYHWGDYSNSLYTYKKEPSDKNLVRHQTELLNIIEVARKKNRKVPPGIHFELGLYLAKAGKNSEAMTHFNQEQKLFPEANKYVEIAKKEMGAE